MFKRPVTWIVFAILAVLSAFVAIRFFPRAFPIVSLDLQMSRQSALQRAQRLAGKYHWGPKDFEQTASFSGDPHVQYYVELEAGGTDALTDMMENDYYHPYTWQVRHFHPGKAHETLLIFKPDGTAYGFVEMIPEDEPGASIPADSALTIAESLATSEWQVDLSPYQLVEESEDVRLGGRTDHTFVYERTDRQIGQAHYRLRLVVSGAQLSELKHFVKVPEGFDRRYEQMRSQNQLLSTFGSAAIVLLYGVGGVIIGLFFLLKVRFVLWRKPLIWASIIAFLQVLSNINRWPLQWMDYDTALSPENFLLQRILTLFGIFIGETLLLAVTFMAAESLSRKAFPHHVQFWKIWRKKPASTLPVWGQTFGGYLWVPFTMIYIVFFYWLANEVLGWWTPSDVLFQPDMLATFFPWLSALAISLHAGFWEEALFRAIPIAGAVLLGRRFGKTGIWLGVALVLQAVIFGAGHANYPQQPAYARILELVFPFIIYGGIYYVFGLLPVIIAHFTYDVVWFALPLFVSSVPGIWLDRILVIGLTLIPVWVIIGARLRTGSWLSIKDYLNKTWKPHPKQEPKEPAREPEETEIPAWASRGLWIAGFSGLILWIAFTPFNHHTVPLRIDKSEAVNYAQQELTARQIDLPDTYRTLPFVLQPLGIDDRFVWQEGGTQVYTSLVDEYIAPPLWKIRYATFEGDIEARAEEYLLSIGNDGRLYRFIHQLPESRQGARLEEEQARELAFAHLRDRYKMTPENLLEVTAEPSKLPNRTDWSFAYADTNNYPLEQGQARIYIRIGGEEITDSYYQIYVPNEWERQERNRTNVMDIVKTSDQGLMILTIFAGAIAAIVAWSRKKFNVKLFLLVAGFFLIKQFIGLANSWPTIVTQFATAQPFMTQVIILIIGGLIVSGVISLGFGLLVGFLRAWTPIQKLQQRGILLAIFAGLLMSGVISILLYFSPSLQPKWPDYSALGDALPVLGLVLSPINRFFMVTGFFLLTFNWTDKITQQGRTRKWIVFLFMLIIGFIFIGQFEFNTLLSFSLAGLVTGLVLVGLYYALFRHQLSLVWIFTAVVIILGQLDRILIYSQPVFGVGLILSVALIALMSWYFYRKFSSKQAA
jgi:hypothetical protein